MGRINQKVLNRFWSKVKKTNSCWIWTASLDSKGYGAFHSVDFMKLFGTCIASRISYFLEYGKIKNRFCVLHKCDNPKCVRSSHLFLGTQTDNIHDMERKKRSSHPSGDSHGSSKLSSKDVYWIRKKSNLLHDDIMAKKLGVSTSAIKKARLRETWKYL